MGAIGGLIRPGRGATPACRLRPAPLTAQPPRPPRSGVQRCRIWRRARPPPVPSPLLFVLSTPQPCPVFPSPPRCPHDAPAMPSCESRSRQKQRQQGGTAGAAARIQSSFNSRLLKSRAQNGPDEVPGCRQVLCRAAHRGANLKGGTRECNGGVAGKAPACLNMGRLHAQCACSVQWREEQGQEENTGEGAPEIGGTAGEAFVSG